MRFRPTHSRAAATSGVESVRKATSCGLRHLPVGDLTVELRALVDELEA